MESITVSADFVKEVKQAAVVMLGVQARILTAVTRLERECVVEGPSAEIAHALHSASVDLAAQWQELDLSLACNDL